MPATGSGEREGLVAVIGSRVLRELGEPRELLQVQVRQVWGSHYRVNILVSQVTAYAASFREDGSVLTADPAAVP